ncbi:cytochrome P450 [Amanita rubescens]|nr:cytochrome P450 [Amanita rubescens]
MSFSIENPSPFGVILGWISDARSSRKVEIALSVALIFLIGRTIRYYQGLKTVQNYPGPRVGFHPLSLFGNVLLPRTWWNPTVLYPWTNRFKCKCHLPIQRGFLYKQYDTDTVCFVPFLYGPPMIYTSNLEVSRQIASNGPGASFVKPYIGGAALLRWGMNVFSANGETWRKHRRIVSPSFNNTLYEHVFDETITVFRDMVTSEKWSDQNEVHVPIFQQLTQKFALLVIENCGFANDGSMSLQKAMQIVNDNIALTVFAPWVMSLPLGNFMQSQVDERRALVQNSKGAELGRDAFTMLVQANEDEAAKYKLSKQELIGNVYTFTQTTATSLASTIAYLCSYPDIQDELVEEIESVIGYERDPTMEDYPKLNKVLSAFLEAYSHDSSPVHVMIRESAEDTVLKIPKPVGQEGYTMLPIPKGTMVTSDTIGLGYNPRYYDEPEKYKPSRWYHTENVESELFTGFSVGTRACIGRKFAVIEAVTFLTMLLRDWRVEPLLKSGESQDEWTKRVFEVKLTLTLGIGNVPVKFMKRQQQS